MSRYVIHLNAAGSWARLCSCPPERLDAVKAACEQLAAALDHGIRFKVIDCASEATVARFDSRPGPGKPHGWHTPGFSTTQKG